MTAFNEVKKQATALGYKLKKTTTKMNGKAVYELWKTTTDSNIFAGNYTLQGLFYEFGLWSR